MTFSLACTVTDVYNRYMDNDDSKPEPIREGRKTVRIKPLTNAQLVYGEDEDAGMEGLREVLAEERWRTGGVR